MLKARKNFLRFIFHAMRDKFRKRRFEKFLSVLSVTKNNTILDVGGSPYFWEGSGLEDKVTILNNRLPNDQPKPYRWVKGDACNMDMFDDRSFCLVFSNSVIEHVGDFSRQQKMAGEIRRVGKKYWVQTPYRHFPIEPHFIFPFYQYLPHPLRIAIARTWPFSYAKILGLDPIFTCEHIWLLNYRQMCFLFPDGRILREKFLGYTKSLVAVKIT